MSSHHSRSRKTRYQQQSWSYSRLVIVALIVMVGVTTLNNYQIPEDAPTQSSTSKSTVVSTTVHIVKADTVSISVTILPAKPVVSTDRAVSTSKRAAASSASTGTTSAATDNTGVVVSPSENTSTTVGPSTPEAKAPQPTPTVVAPTTLAKPVTVPSSPIMKSISSQVPSFYKAPSPSAVPQKTGDTTSVGTAVMDAMAHIDIRELSNAASVSQMYSVSAVDLKAKMDSARQDVAAALGPIASGMMTKVLMEPLVMNMAAVANKVPTLANSPERADFLETAMEVVGKESIAEAAKDPMLAGVLTATIVSCAFGQPVERDQIAAVFPELSKALFEQEKRVITGGLFQKMFAHNPSTPADWKVVEYDLAPLKRTVQKIKKEKK